VRMAVQYTYPPTLNCEGTATAWQGRKFLAPVAAFSLIPGSDPNYIAIRYEFQKAKSIKFALSDGISYSRQKNMRE